VLKKERKGERKKGIESFLSFLLRGRGEGGGRVFLFP